MSVDNLIQKLVFVIGFYGPFHMFRFVRHTGEFMNLGAFTSIVYRYE